MAVLWLILATLILVATYVSLPLIADKTITSISRIELQSSGGKASQTQGSADTRTSSHVQLYAIVTLSLGLFAISFACFLLGRTAFVEIKLAARFSGFADALCIAGDNFDQLERAANLLVPGTKYLSVPEIFSTKDLNSVVEVLKELRPK
jgi:hypothetical protein